MKRSMFCFMTTCLSIIAIGIFSCSVMAQGNGNGRGNGGGNNGGGEDPPPPNVSVGYRVFWPEIPATVTGDILIAHNDSVGDVKGFIFNPGISNDPTDDEVIELLDADGTPLRIRRSTFLTTISTALAQPFGWATTRSAACRCR